MGIDELTSALLRGAVSAAAVAALLLAGQRWGRDVAGLLAGLPTVTGPALVWLALDRGRDFASQAAVGAVLAGAACAVFALAYARSCLVLRRWPALAVASALSMPPLGLLWLPPVPLPLAFGLVALVCMVCSCCVTACMSACMSACRTACMSDCMSACTTACMTALPPVATRAAHAVATANGADGRAAGAAARPGLSTAAVAGVVTALASLLAPHLSPVAAGALTSPPLLAAAVAWELHRQHCRAPVLVFLRGYTAGLVGRCACVAAFGALLLPAGLMQAAAVASMLALALGWVTGRWMGRGFGSRASATAVGLEASP